MSDTVVVSELASYVGSEIIIRGWVESTRAHGKVAFLDVRDGTGVVQGVVVKKEVADEVWERHATLTLETSVAVAGTVRGEPRAPGGHELTVTGLEILGRSDDYPIQPKEHGVDFLLDQRHLWLRSRTQWAGLKVRSEVEQAIHDFFYRRDFVRIDTPILTGAIGEHAGSLFETDYFGEKAYLAQTGQLYGEAAAAAFRSIYTFGPTFRAEKSKTRRHLTEFWMVEPEVAFMDSEGSMRLQEEFVSYLVERALERCQEELKVLERDTSTLATVCPPFPRIDYTDAVARIKELGGDLEWGSDLGARDEVALTKGLDRPLFVFNYPREAKAFYMKENPADPRTVLCNDCLAPEGYGEIIGGSQREDDLERLRAGIRSQGLPEEVYDWYLDLRRYGTFPHSGFGLGVERTVAWITGRPHVRELIPFPRLMTRLRP